MRRRSLSLLLGLALAACSANKQQMGPIDISGDGKPDGMGLDTDGDGSVDAIDTDGDGVADGNDEDGDGKITVWADLKGSDLLDPTEEMIKTSVPELDPDLIDDVDPMHPPLGMSGGEVPIRSSVTPPPTDGTLGAISQGQQGSCAAFANAALVTLVRARREQADPNKVWASAAFLYERQVRDSKVECNGGTYLTTGLNALVSEGAATAEEVPYRSGNNPTLCEQGSMAKAGHLYRIGGWEMVRPFSRAKIKEMLSAGKHIVFGVSLPMGFPDWHGQKASGVYSGQGTCADTQHCGGHAMLLVGYDDARGAYRILNSWGSDWGDRGYMWWAYDDFEARKPYGYIITEQPAPEPFAAPNPQAFNLEVIGAATYADESAQWFVNLRVKASEPFRITKTVLMNTPGNWTFSLDAWVSYGDIPLFAGTGQPPVESAKALVEGVLRDGTIVMKEVAISVPAPAKSGD